MMLQNVALAFALIVLLRRFVWEFFQDRLAALLAPFLLIFSGGLGWWMLVQQASSSPTGIGGLIGRLPHDYTINDMGYRWGNALTTMFITQRSILMGMPVALLIFILWWRSVAQTRDNTQAPLPQYQMIGAGVLAGTLPLVHAHSFLVVMGVGFCLALLFWKPRLWISFLAAALLVGLPEIWYLTHGSQTDRSAFFGWQPGWDKGDTNFLTFWWKNTGVFIPLLLIAFLWRRQNTPNRRQMLFYLPFVLCFVVPNLWKFAPWIWDNNKIMIYWWVASTPFVALVLARLWQRRVWWLRSLATLAFVSMTMAAALDIWRGISGAAEQREFDLDGLALAEIIKTLPPRAVFVHASTYNPPSFLTGRPSLMGYPGHTWSHGIKSTEREAEVRAIYAGEPGTDDLLRRYNVSYVVVGPQERGSMPVNEEFWNFKKKVTQQGEYSIYDAR
jgi:hypothetical protein